MHSITTNDVKGARTRRNGSSSGKGSVSWHAHLGRQSASAKQHYSEVASSGCKVTHHFKKGKKSKLSCTPQKKKMIIGSINTLTCKDESHLYTIVSQCKSLKQSLTFIQETHMTGYNHIHFEDEEWLNWSFLNSGFESKAAAGVGIVLSPSAKLIEDEVFIEGRILVARVIVDGVKVAAICGYAPTDVSAESSKDRFYHLLDVAIKTTKKNHPSFKIIIGGDMNATIGNDSFGDMKCLGPTLQTISRASACVPIWWPAPVGTSIATCYPVLVDV